jgi:UDP-N-acetylglucosamine 4,6-dehydratase
MQSDMKKFFKNKSILITGGTGSFGKATTEYLLKTNPKKIVIFSRDELKQYHMQKDNNDERLRFFLGDVRDKDRLVWALKGIDIVIHAAALKHVPKAELDPSEFIKTNILGSENIIYASLENNVQRVMFISTDKAVNPINLYGSTKLCAEKLFVASNNIVGSQNIKLSISRYGNVINSRGSLLPLISEKKKNKQNIFLTHKDMTRFFITLEEGVKFVLTNIMRMQGGEIFIPKMNSYKIEEIIKKLSNQKTIPISGIRDGEKIHETLIGMDESSKVIDYGKFYLIEPFRMFDDDKRNYKKNILKEKGRKISKRFEYTSKNTINFDKNLLKSK